MSRLTFAWTSKGGSIMQEAAVSFLSTWQNFYVVIGSAAATLTGLMFVVITLIARGRMRMPSAGGGGAAFRPPPPRQFFAAMLVAPLLRPPPQALWPAGLLLGLLRPG